MALHRTGCCEDVARRCAGMDVSDIHTSVHAYISRGGGLQMHRSRCGYRYRYVDIDLAVGTDAGTYAFNVM